LRAWEESELPGKFHHAGWIVCFFAAGALLHSRASGQALSPDEALAHFKVADGFEVELFASEPLVRQPVTMCFDERGRLWVIQYLQYPNPAGLEPVEVDRYLRTKYDRVPEPPPRGPRGADKITILEDTDGDGRADKAKDFVTGLNLASALAVGNGGVYVGQAPYLLFYPDRDHDDVPDGDPEVLLTGFGLEDAHAVMNSLQWGPDGWLYGTQGSTVTADVRGVGFQQGIWRYHPISKRFELFSEGGGNTWGLDFNEQGQAIAGTNWGDALCLHQVQGGYYVKGFFKHGPLHNPYTYGYFEHVKHTGHVGGHVTCGGIVYQGDTFPDSFRNTYVAANLLSNAVYWSKFAPDGSTYRTRFEGTLLETDDMWFRPIDCLGGPDGAVYVADWYDQRANHVIPEDTWDKTNGRVWRIAPKGSRRAGKLDLAAKSNDELISLLGHRNEWHARETRRLLAERRDPSTYASLEALVGGADEHLALEALWTLYASGGWSEALSLRLLDHPSADVRAWTIRWIGDDHRALTKRQRERLLRLAAEEPGPTVRSQLACTCKLLSAADGLPLVALLLDRGEDANDTDIPLLMWWAIEDKATSARERALELFSHSERWHKPIARDEIAPRLARRYLAERSDAGYASCAKLWSLAPALDDVRRLVAAMDQDFSGRVLDSVPAPLVGPLEKLWGAAGDDPVVIRFALRLGNPAAYQRALERILNRAVAKDVRLPLIAAVGQTARADALPRLLPLLDEAGPDAEAIRMAALAALEHFGDEGLAGELLARFSSLSPALRTRVVSVLCGRHTWAQRLVAAAAANQIDPQEVSTDNVRQMLAYNDSQLAQAIEARWGKIRPVTPGEKMAYVPVLHRVLAEGPGDMERGHQLFVKHCATCHTLYGEGNKVGPDLTTADRKSRDSLLINILDPSGTIRPEFVSQVAVLSDGRVLTGLVTESTAERITIVDAKNQKTTIARDELEEINPSTQSLMPERLLETLAPQEVRDLFRYLQSEKPSAGASS
jgi:putative membrane-bound dehydrogenase-like protein